MATSAYQWAKPHALFGLKVIAAQPVQPIARPILQPGIGGSFNPAIFFASGEQGVWYDPSDFSTMFQDSAGTVPVTAVEQPVGRILDKSGRGNHAFQATSTSRPVLSARYNLLTKTEEFDDAVWTKSNATVTANATTAPDGTTTADKLVVSNAVVSGRVFQGFTLPVTPTVLSVFAKAGEWSYVVLSEGDPAATKRVYFDLVNGVVGNIGAGITAAEIQAERNGWYRCSITFVAAGVSASYRVTASNADNTLSTGDGTGGIYIWGADLRVTNDALNQPAYQRVNTATDYDTTGFKPYLRFDGTDDWLQTNSINFTATDKVTVFAGVRKLSDAARGMLVELGSSLPSGAFNISAPAGASPSYSVFSSGSVGIGPIPSVGTFSAPISNVLTFSSNIESDSLALRINQTQNTGDSGDQGTGTYSNAPVYIGRRGGTTLPFNGRLYGLIVRGAQSTAQQIASTETWMNQKTGAY